jgi:hypothetical protein
VKPKGKYAVDVLERAGVALGNKESGATIPQQPQREIADQIDKQADKAYSDDGYCCVSVTQLRRWARQLRAVRHTLAEINCRPIYSLGGIMLVGELRKALENVPDEMDIVVGCGGNQHDAYFVGLAYPDQDGMYYEADDEHSQEHGEQCFAILG